MMVARRIRKGKDCDVSAHAIEVVALIEASKTTLRGSLAVLHVSQFQLSLSDDGGEENLEGQGI